MVDHDGGRLRFTAKSGKAEPMAIQPALTAEEWNAALRNTFVLQHMLAESCDSVRGNDHRRMALTNAALPDDDPRKITRADVALLREILDASAMYGSNLTAVDDGRLDTLAAKLAALLPPQDAR